MRRLATDRLDLYLLHWRGRIPLAETVAAFERLRADGKIVRWGVSNFDIADMRELFALPEGRALRDQPGPVPPGRARHRVGAAAVDARAADAGDGVLAAGAGRAGCASRSSLAIARRLGTTPAALALRWLLRRPDVIAIPESADPAHVRANRAAAALRLDAATLRELDAAFPPPAGPTSLAVI